MPDQFKISTHVVVWTALTKGDLGIDSPNLPGSQTLVEYEAGVTGKVIDQVDKWLKVHFDSDGADWWASQDFFRLLDGDPNATRFDDVINALNVFIDEVQRLEEAGVYDEIVGDTRVDEFVQKGERALGSLEQIRRLLIDCKYWLSVLAPGEAINVASRKQVADLYLKISEYVGKESENA